MIGNIGGYVGLLLGFSILQAPELLLGLFGTINRFYSQAITRSSINVMPNAQVIGNNETLPVATLSESGIPTENKNEIINLKFNRINNRLDRLEELLFDLANKIEGNET